MHKQIYLAKHEKVRRSNKSDEKVEKLMRGRSTMIRSIRTFSCFIVFALTLMACASKPEEALVGRWQEISGAETIEFLKDKSFHGSMIWDMTRTAVNVKGTYSIEGDVVSLKPDKPADLVPMTWKFKLSNSKNELIVTFQKGGALKLDGSLSKYRRVG